MALTAAQISYIRDNSGDDVLDSSSAYEVPDATLQAIYDDTSQGNSDLDRTVYFVILRRYGKAARLVALSGESGGAAKNQKFDQLERLLALWGKRTGIGRSITAEATRVYRADSRQTEEPDYSGGVAGDGDRYIVIEY